MNEEYNFDSETVPMMIQSYMDWEETTAVNAAQKEAKRKTKLHSKESSLDVVKKERGSYITKNEAKVVNLINLINLLQEFENMSISEAGRKVGLSKSTAIRKVKQWNQMTSEIAEKGFPDSIAIKEGKGQPQYLKTNILYLSLSCWLMSQH
ncbi:FKBP12-associated protein [Mucor velutinosus]|uniref:FKBP12-associated protein n=1 Tax=Mucor velutinosus TaxID=708070 RepID=A0AAN7D243_9FUNG|nr:FKBP12-associated protein [Mucor velutinosus]